jgi:hypothetical protein
MNSPTHTYLYLFHRALISSVNQDTMMRKLEAFVHSFINRIIHQTISMEVTTYRLYTEYHVESIPCFFLEPPSDEILELEEQWMLQTGDMLPEGCKYDVFVYLFKRSKMCTKNGFMT